MEASTSLSPHVGMYASRTSSLNHDDPASTRRIDDDHADRPAATAQTRKMTIFKRITIAMKQRENRKLAACYWALAAAGWCVKSLI